jgi:uncharacterized protein with gpF-like domain
MNGKFVYYDKPPTLSDGTTTHAGEIYNCRCYKDPVLPEPDVERAANKVIELGF